MARDDTKPKATRNWVDGCPGLEAYGYHTPTTERSSTMTAIYLYEDNAGGLTLYREGDDHGHYNLELALPDASFEQDASVLAEGESLEDFDTAWEERRIDPLSIPDEDLLAIYEGGRITLYARPGYNGAEYLRVDPEDYDERGNRLP